MTTHYFTRDSETNSYLACDYKGRTFPVMQSLMQQYDVPFEITRPISFVHDVLDHLNGPQYIGGIADEIIALSVAITHRNEILYETGFNPQKVFSYSLVPLLSELVIRDYDWGLLPTQLKFSEQVPPVYRMAYAKEFEELYQDILDKSWLKRWLVDEDCSFELTPTRWNQIKWLLYKGMVQAKRIYRLNSPGLWASDEKYHLLDTMKEVIKYRPDEIRITFNSQKLAVYSRDYDAGWQCHLLHRRK